MDGRRSYESQVWRFIVKEVAGGQVVCQSDSDTVAYEFLREHNRPANLISVLTGEVLVRNY